MATCPNKSHPNWVKLVASRGESMAYYLWDKYAGEVPKTELKPIIQNNSSVFELSEEEQHTVYDNYVNLMDRKREGKAISYEKFNQMFKNLQVFRSKDTYIFGEWDSKNNIFKGRLISSPNIRELYTELDNLIDLTDFAASVPEDIGAMLLKKGMYKLNVDKPYNFRGEDMVKNLYFTNKGLAEKIFKKPVGLVTYEDVIKYDHFFNYWNLIGKLKKEFEDKNFDKLFPILREIGIYDYNAYNLVKKVRQGKVTQEDIDSIIKEIVKNSAVNKVAINKADLINNPKIYEGLNTSLNKTLATFLSKFGITTDILENVQDKLGIDSLSHVDILNKILYTSKNNQEDYPQQAGKVIAFMMQHNPLITEITKDLRKVGRFKNLSKDEMFEAIGDLISEQLYKKTNTEIPEAVLEKIRLLIDQFLAYLSSIRLDRVNRNVAHIADNILIQNQSLITASVFKPGAIGKEVKQINLEDALESDSFANDVVAILSKHFILTGSITLSEQGTVYRPNENQVHDLDWVSSVPRKESIRIFNELFPNNTYVRNIHNVDQEYDTDTWLITPEGYAIKNIIFEGDSNRVKSYDIVNSYTNDVVSTYNGLTDSHSGEVVAKAIDIFSYDTPTSEKTANKEITLKSGITLKIADWRNTFKAKLEFARLKDIWDYNRFTPIESVYNTENINYQLDTMAMSKASPITLQKIRDAAKQMGISIQDLTEYAKATNLDTKSVNGVADLAKGIIAVAQGMEGVTLTEEMVHLATAMLEQTNPKLVTELISKIDKFKIYKATLDTYKNNKYYQINGKPDIRRIKKEAVDKLIAEVIINQNEGTTEFPELMQEENRSMIQRWWDAIKKFLRISYSKSNIDIFEEAAKKIMAGGAGTVADIKSDEIYLQASAESIAAVNKMYDTVIGFDKRLEYFPESPTDTRHYMFDGKRVAKSVTEKIKSAIGRKMPDRSPTEKLTDDQKKEWGNVGHDFIWQYIVNNLIDKDGYKRATPGNVSMTSTLNPALQEKLKRFAEELIGSYKEGTRFIVERMVVNTKEKGMIASRIDFMAIEPDPKTGVKVDILDWKFTSIDKTREEDIPWFKQGEWKSQMGEYTKIMYEYGMQPNQLRKARMMPFIMNYEYAVPGDSKSGLVPKTMEIGKLNSLTETNLYLLPVALNTESTGNTQIDKLVEALRQQWEKLYVKPVAPHQRYGKIVQLNRLSQAIRELHIKLNFEPLISVGKTFLNNANTSIKSFENIDYTKLTKTEVEKKLADLLEYRKSAEKYATLDDVYLSQFSKDGLDDKSKQTLVALEHIASSTGRMFAKIDSIQTEYAIQLGIKEGFTMDVVETENGRRIKAEVAVSGMSKTFLEGSKLSAKIIRLASNLIKNARSLANLKLSKMADEYTKILAPLEKEASSKGVKAFDLIAKMDQKGLHLIKKFDETFWKQIKNAKEKGNLAYLKSLIDVEAYNKLAAEAIARNEEELDNIVFSTDTTKDIETRIYRKKLLKDSIDINRATFNGFQGYQFNRIFNQSIIEEGHYSKEYLGMSEDAKKVWDFFTALNNRAKENGYLEKEGSSFFPLIEATILEKFWQTSNLMAQTKDFFGDFYKVRMEEEQSYAKTDPETGQLKKQIPRFFRHSDRATEQLSRDLNKVGMMWMKSILEYETSKSMENTLLTLHSVEKAKGSLMTDTSGDVITEGGVAKVDERTNKNADILQVIIDDALYKLIEDSTSLGNIKLSQFTEKFSDSKEQKAEREVNIKKGMHNADTLIRALGVGLKPLIGFANWAGTQFQSMIMSGGMYRFREYEKNNIKVSTGIGFTTIEKALVGLIVPLHDDLATEKRREMLLKHGDYISYLGTWSFSDVMMSTNSFPERRLQFANAMSFNDNSMVKDGKIVNIRQYVKQQDVQNKYNLSFEERRALEKTYEARVAELKASSALKQIAKIENDTLVIPGVELEELAKYRTKVMDYNRNLNGTMSADDKAGYRRDSIFTSFMMFKTWIPKLVSVRTLDLNKNVELDQWEYGRARVFFKTWSQLGFRNIAKMRNIIIGNEEGIKIMNDMLEAKRAQHFKKTGQTLEITDEEFYDLIRLELEREMKEIALLFSMMGLLIAAKVAEPPEDATDLEKNRYKYWAKAINKMSDEITFYYSPFSMESITRGTIFPSLGLLTKASSAITSLGKEVYGYSIDDQEMIKKAYPVKYFLNIIPGAAQFQNEILPLVNPELAKEMGIRVTTQSRRS